MDLLADIFKHADVKRRLLNQRSFYDVTTVKFPCDKSIGFHVVTQGEAYLYFENKTKPMSIKKGDLIIMARGRDHVLSTEPDLSTKQIKMATMLTDELNNQFTEMRGKATAADDSKISKVTLVSGAYQLWNEPIHPFFKELPELYVLKNEDIDSFGQIQAALNMLAMETAKPQMGTEGLVQNLLDIIFFYLLRKILENKNTQPQTWGFAIQNESIRKAIELLHGSIGRDWTLDDLAKEVGLSRAGLAQKFKKHLGDTPLHYLTLIRIQRARALLSTTDENLEQIAESVGYSDPFSFSKVFKRITGMPPRDYRSKDQSERNHAHRY